MGQANVNRRLTARRLAQHPLCCFCGGKTPATSLDHVPPKIVFWGKRRPNGLEMPACDACNQGTKKLDQAAGLFARITVTDKSSQDQEEFARIAGSVSRCFPGWNYEIVPNSKQPHWAMPKLPTWDRWLKMRCIQWARKSDSRCITTTQAKSFHRLALSKHDKRATRRSTGTAFRPSF
jgi:hypothetical protein